MIVWAAFSGQAAAGTLGQCIDINLLLVFILFCALFSIIMPPVGAKRKAFLETKRLNALKRWKKDDVEELHPDSDGARQPPPRASTSSPPPCASATTFPPPHAANMSSAAFRHSLLQQEKRESISISKDSTMVVFSLRRLQSLLNLIKCEYGTSVTTEITTDYFDCHVNLRCDECKKVVHYSEPKKCQRSDLTEGNIAHVFHSLSEGYGRAGLSRLSAAVGCQEMTNYTFNRHAQFIYQEMNGFYKEQESVAQQCVEKLYEKEEKGKDIDGKLNIDVSFDGTWLSRGHKSHIGAGFVIDLSSGIVVDYKILSNYCNACASMKKKKDEENFEQWRQTVHAETCQANFSGLSGAMEAETAVRIWGRSEEKGFRYLTFLSDGDSSAYKAVTNMNNGKDPYCNQSCSEENRHQITKIKR